MQRFDLVGTLPLFAFRISTYRAGFAMLGGASRLAAVKTETTLIFSVVPHRVREVSSGFSFATHCALVLTATIQTQVFLYVQ